MRLLADPASAAAKLMPASRLVLPAVSTWPRRCAFSPVFSEAHLLAVAGGGQKAVEVRQESHGHALECALVQTGR